MNILRPGGGLRVAAACVLWPVFTLTANAQETGPSSNEVDLSPVSFETDQASGLRSYHAPVDQVHHAAVVLAVRHGSMHDSAGSAGRAALIGELLRLYFDSDGRDTFGVSVRVERDVTLLIATPTSDGFVELCSALAPVLASSSSLPVDWIARARARAKLRADEVQNVLPGPILRAHAAEVRFGDAPDARLPAGSAEQIERLSDRDIQTVLADAFAPARSFLVVVGRLPENVELAAGIEALTALSVGTGEDPRPGSVDATTHRHRVESGYSFETVDGVEVASHRLVDAPFVTASLPIPSFGEPDFTAHWIAIGVLRGRTARQFQPYRGGEVAAEFPFVDFDPFAATRLVCVNRRGADGQDLSRVRSEIAGVFADLRSHGATAEEIATAARQLATTLALPPFERASFARVAARQPGVLTARAYAIAAYERHGWPASLPLLLQKTPFVHVQRVITAMFDKANLAWVALEPVGTGPESSGSRRK